MANERQGPPPRLVEVTIEWHSDGRRSPLAKVSRATRRVLAVGLTAVVAAVAAIVIADSPSRHSAEPSALRARCYSSTPRFFIGDSHPNTELPVRVPTCP